MSFFDSVNALLEKKKIKLDYPINIVMGHKNSNFIDIELYELNKEIDEILEKKKIDEILKKKEIVSNDFYIVYKKERNGIIFESEDNINIFRGKKNNSLESILNSYKSIGITEDKKFKIYICLLPENDKFTIDGIPYNNGEIEYPDFNQFKYQNLYSYQDQNNFINVIYIEFIVRNARYNNLLSETIMPLKIKTRI